MHLKTIIHISNKNPNFIWKVDAVKQRRIDLRMLIDSTMLCIEIDEKQHKNYIEYDENIRCDNLFMDFSGKYIYL